MAHAVPLPCSNFAPQWLTEAYRSTTWYRSRQEDYLTRTPPKVTVREQALSISEKPNKKGKNDIVNEQLQSKLFMLPTELRLQIYKELIGVRGGIHIVFTEGTLYAYQCQWTRDLTVPSRHIHCWNHNYNERYSPAIFGTDTSSLCILALLQSCRLLYNEAVAYMYSQPTFIFQAYTTFIAFAGAILPQRFNSIQSIQIHQPASTDGDDLSFKDHSILPWPASYRELHEDNITIRNPIFAQLPSPKEPHMAVSKWSHVRGILRQMESLREVKVAMYAGTFTDAEQVLHEEGRRTEGEARMRAAVILLWPPNEMGMWRDFEFSMSVFPNGAKWHGVRCLKKKMVKE